MNTELTLNQKLSKISKEVGAIPKEKKPGSSVSYAYRGIDDVMNKLNPLLAHYEITLQSRVLSHSLTPRSYLKWDNYAKKDVEKSSYYATVILQIIFSDGKETETWEEAAMSEDYGDKAMTQAMSMAYKYAITRKFCILTADTVDPDGRHPERLSEENKQEPDKPEKPPKKTPAKPKLTDAAVDGAALRIGKEADLYEKITEAYDLTDTQKAKLDEALQTNKNTQQ